MLSRSMVQGLSMFAFHTASTVWSRNLPSQVWYQGIHHDQTVLPAFMADMSGMEPFSDTARILSVP